MSSIHSEDTGQGFPLVLVHGFLGSSKMWKPQINFFKKNFRVIAPDLPGFGKSKNIKSHNSIKSTASLLINCLKEKNIDNYNLLGHSMGGMIAQQMAQISGEKISKLVCYSTGPIGEMPGRFETIAQSRAKLKKNGLQATALRIAKTWFTEKEKAKYFHLCSDAINSTSFEATDNALIAMKKWNGLKNLKALKNKTLIIWGNQDRSYSFNQVDLLNKNIKNSELKIFKGCSHNIHLEKPDDFNQAIEEFIKK